MKHVHPLRRCQGFTLVEVMIVVAIVGVLAAIAYPSYVEHVNEARRSEARSNLLELAQFMERHYSANGRYTTAAGGSAAPALPYTRSPKEGDVAFYTLRVTGASDNAYTLNAVPTGSMTGDRCGSLTLSHQGLKGSSRGDKNDCWGR